MFEEHTIVCLLTSLYSFLSFNPLLLCLTTIRHETSAVIYFALMCQLMVVGTIQSQQKFPIWGEVKKETLFSAKSSVVIQHDYETQEQLNSVTVGL